MKCNITINIVPGREKILEQMLRLWTLAGDVDSKEAHKAKWRKDPSPEDPSPEDVANLGLCFTPVEYVEFKKKLALKPSTVHRKLF